MIPAKHITEDITIVNYENGLIFYIKDNELHKTVLRKNKHDIQYIAIPKIYHIQDFYEIY